MILIIEKIKDILRKIFNNYNFKDFDLIIDDGSHQLSDILYSLKFFQVFKKDGIFVIEDYKHPNYYKYNNDIDHILIDELLKNLKKKGILNLLFLQWWSIIFIW